MRRRVGDAARGNPQYGPDSAFYKAMGFVPDSERSSGLTRRADVEEGMESLPQAA